MKMSYEEVLKTYGECVAHVTGWSMEPLFHNRQSIVKVISLDKHKLKVGDIVLYRVDNQYILHRVLEIHGNSIIARGDNNWFLEPIDIETIIGVVSGFWRKPSSRFINCADCWNKLYILFLPALRVLKKGVAKGKQAAKKLLLFH